MVDPAANPWPRAVVLGAGFAGLAAARGLAGHAVEVVVVDQNNFHTFQPLLYQVATAGLEPADIAFPVRAIFGRASNVTFRHALVETVDLSAGTVTLTGGAALSYDYLIVGTGAGAAFLGVPGASSNSQPLYTLKDARRLRNRVLSTLEAIDADPDRSEVCLVVIGGGATGIEIAGALVELLDIGVRKDGLRIDQDRTRVVLIDGEERLLSGFKERSGKYALETLEVRGVKVRLGELVAEVSPDGVLLKNGERISADVVVWAGGVTVEGTLASTLPGNRERGGRVSVESDLSLPGRREVFVVGDAAAVPLGPSGGLCPQLAQVAIQSGNHAARQVLRDIGRLDREDFEYDDKGMMATIGRHAAVAELAGRPPVNKVIVRGTLGWLAWLGLHLVYLIGFRNRLMVLINWFWRYLDWPAGPRIIVDDLAEETESR